jgi:DNA-binding transcriptional MerR regulator
VASVGEDRAEEFGIGEVAELTGLSVHALRFYEREGLLLSQHVPRGAGGHRRFDPDEIHWLRICSKLRTSGMPLAEIGRLAELVREGPGNESERLELLRAQERRVEGQLADLGDCLRVISRKVGVYERQLSGDGDEDLLALRR